MIVLTLNGGSSSLKFGLYRTAGADIPLIGGEATDGVLSAFDASGSARSTTRLTDDDPASIVDVIATLLSDAAMPIPEAIGHRVVHGGASLHRHCLIDDGVLERLRAAGAMSPLHAPAALGMIAAAGAAFPHLPQVACFDTAFHADLPDIARTLPIPRALRDTGLRRYGFHGLSCESIVRQLGRDLPGRLIVAHLGSGASVTAIRDGRSIDTSMGLTPTGGVVMATRSGDLDPGLLIYLLREKGYDAATLERLVDHESGLLGISGTSGDMRRLQADAGTDPNARLAVATFCRSVAKQVAAMTVSLGGLDMLVFTGGIGEHDGDIRARIGNQLGWIGVRPATTDDEPDLGTRASGSTGCDVRVLPSEEDAEIARHVGELVTP